MSAAVTNKGASRGVGEHPPDGAHKRCLAAVVRACDDRQTINRHGRVFDALKVLNSDFDGHRSPHSGVPEMGGSLTPV